MAPLSPSQPAGGALFLHDPQIKATRRREAADDKRSAVMVLGRFFIRRRVSPSGSALTQEPGFTSSPDRCDEDGTEAAATAPSNQLRHRYSAGGAAARRSIGREETSSMSPEPGSRLCRTQLGRPTFPPPPPSRPQAPAATE